MTGDRITEVRELIGRFPERGEYQISTSEFGQVKSRILAIGGATRGSGQDEKGRPTLKRRPQTANDDDTRDSDTPNRRVLKPRDESERGYQTGTPPKQNSA